MKTSTKLLAAADLYNACKPANVAPIVPTQIKLMLAEFAPERNAEEELLRQLVGKIYDGLAYGNW